MSLLFTLELRRFLCHAYTQQPTRESHSPPLSRYRSEHSFFAPNSIQLPPYLTINIPRIGHTHRRHQHLSLNLHYYIHTNRTTNSCLPLTSPINRPSQRSPTYTSSHISAFPTDLISHPRAKAKKNPPSYEHTTISHFQNTLHLYHAI
jgi:hypothetical protein